MFDIGFWELVVVAIVALLVVGPERLPQMARDAARWLRAAQRMVADTRREIERELDVSEQQREFRGKIADLDRLMRDAPDRNPEPGPERDQGPA